MKLDPSHLRPNVTAASEVESKPTKANAVSNEAFVNEHWETAAEFVKEKRSLLPVELLIAESIGIRKHSLAKLPSKEEVEALQAAGKKVLFSENAIREALSLGNKEEEFETREHVQGIVFSIDSYVTKDLDNALSFRKNEEGLPVIGVHAVDLSTWLRGAGALDHSARLRRETAYLKEAGIVLPMLPLSLCENKLSLFEGQPRLTKSVELTFDDNGNLVSTRVFNSQLKNEFRRDDDDALKAVHEQPNTAFAEALLAMNEIVAKAKGRASVGKLMKPEKLVQFFTTVSASVVGEELKENGLEASYRNQLEMNTRSIYEAEAQGHASIGVDAYTPWTGPMRNYAHLDVQRAMDRLIANKKPEGRKQELDQGLRQRQLNRMNGLVNDARMRFSQEIIEITRQNQE